MTIATLNGTVGSILAGGLKELVEKMAFEGHNISIWMGKGWISRSFVIKGDLASVEYLKLIMAAHNREVDKNDYA